MIDITIKTTMVLALILLSSLPRRLIEPSLLFLFVIIGGGGYYSNPGALKGPPPAKPKKTAETKEFESKIDSFLSASRHVFFDLIEPASKRTQEHVQGHIGLK